MLYDALGLTTLDASAHRRALARVAIVSSLYGAGPPRRADRAVPARRRRHPARARRGRGALARRASTRSSARRAGSGLVVDLRSSTYAAFWRPAADLARGWSRCACCTRSNGRRQVVSHFNKATKGRLVRALLEDGRDAAHAGGASPTLLADLGWTVEVGPATGRAPGSTSWSASSERLPALRVEHLPGAGRLGVVEPHRAAAAVAASAVAEERHARSPTPVESSIRNSADSGASTAWATRVLIGVTWLTTSTVLPA